MSLKKGKTGTKKGTTTSLRTADDAAHGFIFGQKNHGKSVKSTRGDVGEITAMFELRSDCRTTTGASRSQCERIGGINK